MKKLVSEMPEDPYDRIRVALSAGLCVWPASESGIAHGTDFARTAFRELQRTTRARTQDPEADSESA